MTLINHSVQHKTMAPRTSRPSGILPSNIKEIYSHALKRMKPRRERGASSVEGRQTIKSAMRTLMQWTHGNEKHNHGLVLLRDHGCIVAKVLADRNHTEGLVA